MKMELAEPESVGMCPKRLGRIEPRMRAFVDEKRVPGVCTLVARRGRVVHFEQVGWMDEGAGLPLRADAIYRIYSMTKPIVCTALMSLYEEGHFQLFEPVPKYLPFFEDVKVMEGGVRAVAPEQMMTVRHLMTHTAGLTYDFLADSPVGELYRQARLLNDTGRSLEAMVRELARIPLAYHPGSRWSYGLSIDVAAHLVEVLSGRPLGDFLEERIFGPLGMADTGFYVPEEKRERYGQVYGFGDIAGPGVTMEDAQEAWSREAYRLLDTSETYPVFRGGFARGGHGLASTAQDYARFAQMLLNGGELDGARVLGRKTLELMHANHLPEAFLPIQISGLVFWRGYGFGLGSRVLMDAAASEMPGSAGEFGWGGAAKTYYWVDPREKIVGVLMAQYMMGNEVPEKTFQALVYQAVVD